MKLRGLIDEDIANYKKTSMFLIFPNCSFKCDKENGTTICQNLSLMSEPIIEISKEEIAERYINNPLTHAIVCGGLEPFDSEFDLIPFIDTIRNRYHCNDDIVIYTGYTEEELQNGYRSHKTTTDLYKNQYSVLKEYKNIIIKYGRFIPNDKHHYDKVLGVELASSNQYAVGYNMEICDENSIE